MDNQASQTIPIHRAALEPACHSRGHLPTTAVDLVVKGPAHESHAGRGFHVLRKQVIRIQSGHEGSRAQRVAGIGRADPDALVGPSRIAAGHGYGGERDE